MQNIAGIAKKNSKEVERSEESIDDDSLPPTKYYMIINFTKFK
jgi:hypothetical protein